MENNEIIMNEEVMEATEEIVEAVPCTGKSVATVIGVTALVGGAIALGYKFVAKPIIAKLKAKKEAKAIEVEPYDVDDCEE
jgi:2-keto-3-deoxy-L-rhamnonate aldolase RhmA